MSDPARELSDNDCDSALEAAVLADIPHADGTVLAFDRAEDGSAALVLLDVNPAGGGGLWLSYCEQRQGTWSVLALTEATALGHNHAAGRWVSFACGEDAPNVSQKVRLKLPGLSRERPVVDGHYVVTIWHPHDRPEPTDTPLVTFA